MPAAFLREAGRFVAVPVTTKPVFKAGVPRSLFSGSYSTDISGNANYNISPDGKQFVLMRTGAEVPLRQLHVVLNWFDELERLVPTDN